MGQYYTIINIDKKEKIEPFDGIKLMEFSYNDNNTIRRLTDLLAGEWKGDRVYVVGDYAEDMEETSACYNSFIEARTTIENDRTLTDISETGEISDTSWRYIINHTTREYIDLEHCPIEWIWYDKDTKEYSFSCVSPLSLLLAMGNGLGGGDYRNEINENLVGSWCRFVQSLEVQDADYDISSLFLNYTEYCPNFTEREEPLFDREEAIKEYKKGGKHL